MALKFLRSVNQKLRYSPQSCDADENQPSLRGRREGGEAGVTSAAVPPFA